MTYLPKHTPRGFSEILNEELHKQITYTNTGLPDVIRLEEIYNVKNFNNTGQAHSFGFVGDEPKQSDFLLFTKEHNITKAICGNPSNLFPITVDTNSYDSLGKMEDTIEINNFDQLDEFLSRDDNPVLVCGYWSHKTEIPHYVTKTVLAGPQTMGEALNLIV